jgi:hypothetical protein
VGWAIHPDAPCPPLLYSEEGLLRQPLHSPGGWFWGEGDEVVKVNWDTILICRWNPYTCGYVTGVHDALVPGIPGLKSETWGTLRVFAVGLIESEDLCTGLSPYL